MSVLSKPLLFGSRWTKGVSQNYRRDDSMNNAHFWIVKNHRVIDPTRAEPYPNGRRIYLPFDETTQKELSQEWMVWACRVERAVPSDILRQIKYWDFDFDVGTHGKCWFNALNYQMNYGGEIVCGLMGHYSRQLGYVDTDYGY